MLVDRYIEMKYQNVIGIVVATRSAIHNKQADANKRILKTICYPGKLLNC